MKQKATLWAIMLIVLITPQNVMASTFSAISQNGQTLYYNIVNGGVSVTYQGNSTTRWDNESLKPSGIVVIPDSVVYNNNTYAVISIDDYAFTSCSTMTSIIIGNNVSSIGTAAFAYCVGLTSVTMNNAITYIGSQVFLHCTSLTSISIGGGINAIGDYAFAECYNLSEIYSNATIAPTLAMNSFAQVPSIIPIYIPCGSQLSYFSRWPYFSNFIEATGYSFSAISDNNTMGSIIVLTAPTCQSPTAVFNASANHGYVFDHWSDGNTDNPRALILTSDTSIVGYFTIQPNDTVFYHDTTYINVHDTTVVHDTTYLPVYVHDTTTLHDTLYVAVHDTIIAYVNVPVHDTVFAYIEVPVHDTVYLPQYIYDTIWLHDTITIHDTIYISGEGIDGVDALNAKVYSCNGQIVVDGASGNTVTLYDASGRVLAIKQDNYSSLRFDTPVSGTYMIKIGNYLARKVVVIR